MKWSRGISASVFAVLAAACSAHQLKPAAEADVAAINALQAIADEAVTAGNTEGYLALLTADAVLMPPGSPALMTHDEIRSWSQRFAEQFVIESYVPVDHELVVSGDWAFRRSSATFRMRPRGGGDSFSQECKFVIVYRRQPDGSWKIARDIFNFNSP